MPAQEITSRTDLLAGYRAARARLWPTRSLPPKPAAVVAAEPPLPVSTVLRDIALFTDEMWSETSPRLKLRGTHAIVAKFYGVTVAELRGRSRMQPIVRPRQIAAYICARHRGMSMPQIGRFTNRDHTTILHSRNEIERRIAADPAFAAEIATLVKLCMSGAE